MGDEAKIFTLSEVSEHNHARDCWIVISGKVYDVTKFLEDHPGGDEVLLSSTGKDATDDFEDVGHSESAREMMEKYYVGEIDPTTIPTPPKQPTTIKTRPLSSLSGSSSSSYPLPFSV